MSARIQRVRIDPHRNPVVFRAHHLSRYVWIFTPAAFTPSPWLRLHRQSLRDNQLDRFLVDQWRWGYDNVEVFFCELYNKMGLGAPRGH